MLHKQFQTFFTLDNAGDLCFTKNFIRQYSWLPLGSWQKPKQNEATPHPQPPLPTMQQNERQGNNKNLFRVTEEVTRSARLRASPLGSAFLSSVFAVLTLDFSCGSLTYQLMMNSASSECRGHCVTDSVLSLSILLLLVSLCQHQKEDKIIC